MSTGKKAGFPDAFRRVRRSRYFGEGASVEQGFDVLVGVEGDQVVGAFAQTDELYWDTELSLDRESNATFRRAVELRQHDTGQLSHITELLGLHQAILPGRGVENEKHLSDDAGLLARLGSRPWVALREIAHLATLLRHGRQKIPQVSIGAAGLET